MPDNHNADRSLYIRLAIRCGIMMLLSFTVIFLAAGRINYWQGWVYYGTFMVYAVITIYFFSDKKELIQERMKPGPGVKWWDRVFYAVYFPMFYFAIVIGSMDAGRYRWSNPIPPGWYILIYLFFVFGLWFSTWAMYTNRFFSSMVRIQSDRGHVVVQEGPYRWIRHPGYAGAVLFDLCIPSMLGSQYALIPIAIVISALIIRTYLEDSTLQKELTGYLEYTQKVRYRLFPGLW